MKIYNGVILENYNKTRKFKIISSNEVISKKKGIKIKYLDTNKRAATTYKSIINNTVGKPRKKTNDQFKQEVSRINPNINILGEYKDANTHIKCECLIDGHIWNPIAQSLITGRGCPVCAKRKLAETFSLTHEEFIRRMSNVNTDIEILGDYKNGHTKIKCRCKVDGYEWYTLPNNLLKGSGCPKCSIRNNSGSNCHLYNHNLTDEEREYGRNIEGYTEWRNKVYERDKYTCQCCGDNKGGNLNAHHLNGYHWFKEGRTDVNNGITLCDNCHKEFHDIYGYNNNTKKQYEEFIINKNKSAS